MMIYNTVDIPVMVTVGDRTFRMERDSEIELKLPAGEYFFSIYKIDPYTEEPIRKYKTDYYPSTGMDFSRGKWGKTDRMAYDRNYNSTAICYGAAARLTLRRATKLYIRDTYSNSLLFRLSNERYFTDLFDFIIEEGELNYRKDGFPDEQTRTKLIHSIYWQFVASILSGIAIIGGVAALAFWAFYKGFTDVAALFIADPRTIVFVLAPVLMAVYVGYDIYRFRQVKDLKKLPLMPTKEEYDYL